VVTSKSPKRDRVGFAVAGLGAQGHVLAEAITKVDGARLVIGASRSPDLGTRFSTKFAVPTVLDYEALSMHPEVDAVVVATSNELHHEVAAQALRAGRHVLCEKPMALSSAQARSLNELADSADRMLFVGYQMRFLDVLTDMRARIGAGAVGRPLDIRMQRQSQHAAATVQPWRRDLARAGAGVLADVAMHLIDLVSFLTALDTISVFASASPERSQGIPDDRITVMLRLEHEAIATVSATRGVLGSENDIHIHGDVGAVCTGPLRWVDEHTAIINDGSDTSRVVHPAGDPYAAQIQAVIDELDGHRTVLARGADGLRGVQIFEAALLSLSTKQETAVRPDSDPGPMVKDVKGGRDPWCSGPRSS
jgi:1,5-anhydro-D-fructose reductase (1,5-anhydro-D-mannitol-forming)